MTSLKQATVKLALGNRIGRSLKTARIANAGAVLLDGQTIPPASIRLGGHNFADDRDFLDCAKRDARRLQETLGVDISSRVLDIGCGVGRLPIGIRAQLGSLNHYTGIDVDAGSIAWCEKHILGEDVAFIHLDLANERYNPSGSSIDQSFRLPLADASFDVIHLYSVFSHMETDDVVAYLREFARLLAPDGAVFLTAFLEDGVAEMTVNPSGYGSYPGEWEGALHCVRFDHSFFASLVDQAGLGISRFDHASDTDGQSAVFLERQ
ncbi:MAG TPA: class I SAM-dependent methyltransferase [Solirubrobacteraceae bacterium]